MARPSKLTEQVRVDLAAAVAAGATAEVAAAAAGVGSRTVRTWLAAARELRERKEQGHRPTPAQRRLLALLDDVERAEARLEVQLTANIARAAASDWRASSFLLERRFPERWAGSRRKLGRPPGSTSAPDRPNAEPEPTRVRLRRVR